MIFTLNLASLAPSGALEGIKLKVLGNSRLGLVSFLDLFLKEKRCALVPLEPCTSNRPNNNLEELGFEF